MYLTNREVDRGKMEAAAPPCEDNVLLRVVMAFISMWFEPLLTVKLLPAGEK